MKICFLYFIAQNVSCLKYNFLMIVSKKWSLFSYFYEYKIWFYRRIIQKKVKRYFKETEKVEFDNPFVNSN